MRLIDADTLEGRILMDAPGFMDGGSEITKAFILAMIKTRSVTPTVDAIPVIRCKDCKYCKVIDWDDSNPYYGSCQYFNTHTVDADGFCYKAERKDSD